MPAIISMSSGPYSASDLFEFQRNLWEGVRAKSRQASAASLGGGEGEGVTPNQFVVDSTAHTSLLPVPKRHGGCDESSEEESWEPVKHHRHHHQRRRQQQPHDDVVEAEAPLRNEVLEEREEHEAEEMKNEEEAASEEEDLSPLNVKGMFSPEAEAACDEDLRGSDRMAHTQRVHQNRASQRHTTHEHRKCSKPGSCVANQGKFCAACRPALGARLIRVDTAKAQAREAQLYGNWRDYSRYGPG